MTECGVVKKVKRGIAFVEIERNEKCDGCKMCAFGNRSKITMPSVCEIAVEEGQTVSMEMPDRPIGAVALSIYAVPLLTTVLFALIGLAGTWQLQISLAAAGLVLGLAAVVPIERLYRRKSGALPKVISVIVADENATHVQTENTNENGE